MTGNYSLILPLMAGNILAWGFATRLRPVGLYNALLLQDGISLKRIPAYRGPQDYRNLPVSTIMTHEVSPLLGNASVEDERKRLHDLGKRHSFYPVVDPVGHLLGVLTLNDIARQRFAEESDL